MVRRQIADENTVEQKLLKAKETSAEVIGGALAVILIYLLGAFTQVAVPPEVAAAVGAIMAFAAGFLPRTTSS